MGGSQSSDVFRKGLLLYGPSGIGKGSQADFMQVEYGVCHVDAGRLVREAATKDAGLQNAVDKGELVPNDVVLDLVDKALRAPRCATGFLLSGVPRNMEQAEKLDEILTNQQSKIVRVLNMMPPEDLQDLKTRLVNRSWHLESGRRYSPAIPEGRAPKRAGVDDVTGQPLAKRPEDSDDAVIQNKINLWSSVGVPVTEHYRNSLGDEVHDIPYGLKLKATSNKIRMAMGEDWFPYAPPVKVALKPDGSER